MAVGIPTKELHQLGDMNFVGVNLLQDVLHGSHRPGVSPGDAGDGVRVRVAGAGRPGGAHPLLPRAPQLPDAPRRPGYLRLRLRRSRGGRPLVPRHGSAPPTPTWGNVIADGRDYLREAPWICLFPGAAISATVC